MQRREKVTIVSMFVDLGKRKNKGVTSLEYIQRAEPLMAVDENMILFIEPDLIPVCWSMRRKHNLLHRTFLIPFLLEESPYYQYLETIHKFVATLKGIWATSPRQGLYRTTMFSKWHVISRALEINPFDSSHFFWCDFGISHFCNFDSVKKDNLFAFATDKIRLTLMYYHGHNTVSNRRQYYEEDKPGALGGLFCGNIKYMQKFCQIMAEEVALQCKEGWGAVDEQVFPYLMRRYPGMWHVRFSNWGDLFSCHVRCLHEEYWRRAISAMYDSWKEQDYNFCYYFTEHLIAEYRQKCVTLPANHYAYILAHFIICADIIGEPYQRELQEYRDIYRVEAQQLYNLVAQFPEEHKRLEMIVAV